MKNSILLSVALLSGLAVAPAQTRVDLTIYQTPIKNQDNRYTCIAFSAVAALEARYKRTGVTLDLSEEFVNYIGKLMWLHPYWNDPGIAGQFWITTSDRTENQLCATGGGGGVGHAHNFVNWMRVPLESDMPNVPNEYPLPYPWNDTWWNSQKNINAWNLDPANLPLAALQASSYYSATGVVDLGAAGSRSTTMIESVLRSGYEVIWDGVLKQGVGNAAGIWHTAGLADTGGHSMLIVGYDRTSADPNQHYFIVKNSWGSTANPGGYTFLGYDFITSQGYNACYLTGASTPSAWPQLRALGRRNISFDGHHGTLDIYHLPGSSTALWANYGTTYADRRLGTFIDPAGNVFRVNGFISGNTVTFWFKGANPNMRWDEQRETPTLGQMFSYSLLDDPNNTMAGVHWDNAGLIPAPPYGGYAARPLTMQGSQGFAQPVFDNGQAWTPSQWIGEWRVIYGNRSERLAIQFRDDTLIPAADRSTYAGFYCLQRNGTTWLPCVAKVDLANARQCMLTWNASLSGSDSINAYMLSWERGVAAGNSVCSGVASGAQMVRIGNHTFGSVTQYGTACAGLQHSVTGTLEVGYFMTYRIAAAPAGALTILAMGLSRTASGATPLPASLTALGAPGCSVVADPQSTLALFASGTGSAQASFVFNNSALVGMHLYTQGFAMAPAANALGLISSNGLDVVVGGLR
jgi:hypothetical protein